MSPLLCFTIALEGADLRSKREQARYAAFSDFFSNEAESPPIWGWQFPQLHAGVHRSYPVTWKEHRSPNSCVAATGKGRWANGTMRSCYSWPGLACVAEKYSDCV